MADSAKTEAKTCIYSRTDSHICSCVTGVEAYYHIGFSLHLVCSKVSLDKSHISIA